MTVTGFGIAMAMVWAVAESVLLHGLVFGTLVLALIRLAGRMLRKVPRRTAIWLWLPLLILVISPLLPGIGIDLPALPLWVSTDAETTGTAEAGLENEISAVIGTEVMTEQAQVTIVPLAGADGAAASRLPAWQYITALIWLVGAAAVLGYRVYTHIRVRQMCSAAEEIGRRGKVRIETLSGIRTPFVYGLFRPRIILPRTPTLGARETEMILTHELVHIRRLDVLWRGLWEAALCIYWFQPLLWCSEDLFIADTEGACDEAVLSLLDADNACRADYAQTLLLYAGPRTRGYPTAFGMTEMQARIQNILHPGSTRAVTVFVLCAAVIVISAVALISFERGDAESGLPKQDPVSAEITEGQHTAVLRIDPVSALFGFVDGYIEARPEVWGTTDLSFALPVGWSVEPKSAVYGSLIDAAGNACGTYSVTAFSPIDDAALPPENIPPEGEEWKAIYSDMRLSIMQNIADADYHPIVSQPRFESAVAVMDRAIYEEGVAAAAWAHETIPVVLAYDQDCSMYVQMIFDAQTDAQAMEMIAASIRFEKAQS